MRAVSQDLLLENAMPGRFRVEHTQEPLNHRLPVGIDDPLLP